MDHFQDQYLAGQFPNCQDFTALDPTDATGQVIQRGYRVEVSESGKFLYFANDAEQGTLYMSIQSVNEAIAAVHKQYQGELSNNL